MPFEKISGLKGKVYTPEASDYCCKKHSCKDCFSCQNCSDDRCRVCLANEFATLKGFRFKNEHRPLKSMKT